MNYNNNNKCNLTLQDVTCPICYRIMIEPVVMPCNHGLCTPCFQETVAKAALACPFCKKRISIWLRNATKKKQLVHTDLWDWIKENFKNKVEQRLNGMDDSEEEDDQPNISLRISEPGEIREEFTLQLKKLEEEERSRKEKEEKESMKLISKLQNEDKEEARSCQSFQGISPLNSSSPLNKQRHIQNAKTKGLLKRSRSSFFPLASSTPKQLSLDFFLKRSSSEVSKKPFKRKCLQDITAICSSDSEDSQEFCPQACQKASSSNLGKENNIENAGASAPSLCSEKNNGLTYASQRSFKDKVDGSSNVEDASCHRKASNLPPPPNDTQVFVAAFNDEYIEEDFLQKLIEEQKRLEERLKQEKEDELYAKQLEKDMKKVNRGKGTKDEYCLRKRISDYLLPSSSKNPPQKRPLERDKSSESSPYERFSKSPRL